MQAILQLRLLIRLIIWTIRHIEMTRERAVPERSSEEGQLLISGGGSSTPVSFSSAGRAYGGSSPWLSSSAAAPRQKTLRAVLSQRLEIELPVGVGEEDVLPVVSTLRDMVRMTGHDDPSDTRHESHRTR